jgi:hypothetical protein
MLLDARQRSLASIHHLEGQRLFGPGLPIINPPFCRIGQVAWFRQRWTLRRFGERPPLLAEADSLVDSAVIPQPTHWDLRRSSSFGSLRAKRLPGTLQPPGGFGWSLTPTDAVA